MSRDKESIRQELWARFAELWPELAQPDRPPKFPAMGKAAERLRRTREYQAAHTLVIMPDPVLLQIRINALFDNKTLICATPGLKHGVVRIEPKDIPVALRRPSLGGNALAGHGRVLRFPKAKTGKAELMVVPCLGLDPKGFTLGDGRGLNDLAYAMFRMLGTLQAQTPVAVILDDEQILGEELPKEAWDLQVNLAVGPQSVTRFETDRARVGLEGLPERLVKLPVVQGVKLAMRRRPNPA